MVIPIKYAKAANIAAVFTKVVPNSASKAATSGGPARTSASGAFPSAWESPLSGTNHFAPVMPSLLRLGPAQITSDERTNSLLVRASPQDIRRIKEIISELDHVLTQFLIEAAVVAVALKNSET